MDEWLLLSGTDRPVLGVEDAVEAADPEAGAEELLVAGGVAAGEPGGGAEGEPGEEGDERGEEEHGLGLGEAADGVEGEDGGEEVEGLVAGPGPDGPDLPVGEGVAVPGGGEGDAGGAVGREVVARVARAERRVVGEHPRRRARRRRHGRCCSAPAPLLGSRKSITWTETARRREEEAVVSATDCLIAWV